MSSSSTSRPTAEGPGSVSEAPDLPAGFTDTFTSRYVDTGEVGLHAVIGGDGPPLLLIHGWPGSWYYWRLVMPALARDFEVIAVDERGLFTAGGALQSSLAFPDRRSSGGQAAWWAATIPSAGRCSLT